MKTQEINISYNSYNSYTKKNSHIGYNKTYTNTSYDKISNNYIGYNKNKQDIIISNQSNFKDIEPTKVNMSQITNENSTYGYDKISNNHIGYDKNKQYIIISNHSNFRDLRTLTTKFYISSKKIGYDMTQSVTTRLQPVTTKSNLS